MKGNDGRGARRRKAQQLSVVGGTFVCFLLAAYIVSVSVVHRNGGNGRAMLHKIREQPVTRKLRRAARRVFFLGERQPDEDLSLYHRKQGAMLSGNKQDNEGNEMALLDDSDPQTRKALERILKAELHLVDIEVVGHEYGARGGSSSAASYSGFYGLFCPLDWSLQKDNPSQVPMFKDLLEKSKDCDPAARSKHRFDLRHLVALLRAHDWQLRDLDSQSQQLAADDADSPTPSTTPKILDLTAVVFHESRCGSTLVANSFAAMDPQRHRVYSESSPPIKMNKLCEMHGCSSEQRTQLWQDVMYIMSRTNDPQEERVFFKFQSAMTIIGINSFHQAFPTVPWFFIYRDPVQVLMSHAKNGALEAPSMGNPHSGHAVCLRSRRNPPEYLLDLLPKFGHDDGPSSLTLVEYCAMHLATLTEYAYEQVQNQLNDSDSSGIAVPINYDGLMDSLKEIVLPYLVGRPLYDDERSNIDYVSSFYSKGGRTGRIDKKFDNDNEKKEQEATAEYRDAASRFLDPSYQKLDTYSKHALKAMAETSSNM